MDHTAEVKRPLVTADAVGLVVGIIIGAGIFETPAKVCAAVATPAAALALWAAGAVAALCGALCYAELAAAYPTDAGEAEYFTHAFGRFVGWYFTWIQLVCFRTAAAIVSIAYIFAENASKLLAAPTWALVGGVIVALTAVNALGLRPGKWTQDVLAAVKVLGLAAVVAAGLWLTPTGEAAPQPAGGATLAFAVVLIMYAYSGWHEAAYIVGDLRAPSRSLPRAMVLGVGVVAAVYLAVNVAAMHALGFDGLRDLAARGEKFGVALFDRAGLSGAAFAALVVLVTLGSTNGTILSGSRLFSTVGATQPGYGWLALGRTRRDAPLAALAVQAAICLAFIAVIELTGGQAGQGQESGFDRIVAVTSPVLWVVFLGAGVALVVLRSTEPARPRPFRVPLYPLVPAVYISACGFMLHESVEYALTKLGTESWLMLGLLALGVPYWFATLRRSVRADASAKRR